MITEKAMLAAVHISIWTAVNRRSLHRRPRELPSLGHHHPPADLDHQGSPGGRV
jgi:hypothetical protein